MFDMAASVFSLGLLGLDPKMGTACVIIHDGFGGVFCYMGGWGGKV